MMRPAAMAWAAALLLGVATVPVRAAGERPVMKVVRLLQDMQAELQNDLEDDRAVHEKLDCWCKTNEAEKTKAIEFGEARSAQLKSTIDESTAKVMELKAKRKATMDELYADQKALGDATELRMKENKKFHAEEADLMEAVAASKQAIVVLSKHHPELAQLRSAASRLGGAQVQKLVAAGGRLRREQLEVLKNFLAQASQASSFLAVPGFQSYAPQSGQIYGILQQLQADFENSLSEAQRAEQKAVADFQNLKAAKESEIESAKNQVTELDAAIADFDAKAVQAAKELDDRQEQLALDREFLSNLQAKCANSEAEFQERVKSRLDEIAAVQDTIKILNSDDSFDLFGRSLNSLFLQTGSRSSGREVVRRQRAAAVLRAAATHLGSPQLSLLATAAQLDTFEKVKQAIDKLVEELAKQQKDEVAHRDWCIDEFAKNDRAVAAAEDKQAGLQAKIADLEKTIAAATASIESSKAAMAELQVQMKRASETREAENADYHQTVVDQHLTQEILKKAVARMSQVYALAQEDQPGAPHIQTSGTHTDPGNGPARFNEYAQHAGGSKVLAMLSQIIADSQKAEAEAQRAEADSQTAYESFMQDSNKSLIAHAKSINDLSGQKAGAEESLSLAKSDLRQVMSELEGLNDGSKDLHGACDYVIKNFDARQAARTAESEALKEAKAILSGMH